MTTSGLQQFDTRANVRLEVRSSAQSTVAAPVNLCVNGDAALGCWGWQLEEPSTQLQSSWSSVTGSAIKVINGTASWFGTGSSYVPVTPGEYVGGQYLLVNARATAASSNGMTVWWQFWKADYTPLTSTSWPTFNLGSGTNTYYSTVSGPATAVPAGAAFVSILIRQSAFPATPANDYFTFTGVNIFRSATNLGSVAASYRQPVYTNVLDACTDIGIKRASLNASTLTAHLSGPTYDPATSTVLAKGTPLRATAWDATSSTWEPLFTGTITDAVADYYTLNNNPAKVYTTITLTANDAVTTLANTPTAVGAANVPNGLPYLLAGQPCPWLIEGWPGTFPLQGGVTTPAKGSLLDAIVNARASESLGLFTWVDRAGMLRAPLSSTPGLETGLQVLGQFPYTTNCNTSWSGTQLTMTSVAAGDMTAYAANYIDILPGQDYKFALTIKGIVGLTRAVTLSVTWLSIDGVTQVAAPVVVATGNEATVDVPLSGTVTAPANAYGLTYTIKVTGTAASEVARFDNIAATLAPVQFGDTAAYAPASSLDSYSAVDIDYSTASLINQVTITDGTTTWGPYADQPSVNKNGPASASYTVNPAPFTNTTTRMATMAAKILAANSTPVRAVRSMVLPVLTDAQRRHAIRIDLAHIVGVMRTGLLAMANHRVTGIEHKITVGAGGDRALNAWTVTYSFDPSAATPVPTVAAGGSAGDGTNNDTSWQTPSLQNGWVMWAGAPFGDARYRRLGNVVMLAGLVKNGTTAQGTVIFTLPVGYRPPAQRVFPVTENNAISRIDIAPDGSVVVQIVQGNSYLSFDGITFTTD